MELVIGGKCALKGFTFNPQIVQANHNVFIYEGIEDEKYIFRGAVTGQKQVASIYLVQEGIATIIAFKG